MGDRGHLQTQAHELIKQYITYDGSGRTQYVYTVHATAEDNCPCSVVRYSYDGATSRVVYMKEYTGTWDTAWEVF